MYVNDYYRDKANKFGYTWGLPNIEIHNPKGKYSKCGIYLRKMSDADERISKQLEKEGYLILKYNKDVPLNHIKISINKVYLNLSNKSRKRKRNYFVSEIKNERKKKKKKRYKFEKDFHQDCVIKTREKKKKGKLPKRLIFEGRLQGNIGSKKVTGFSNRMGYKIDSSDFTFKNKSPCGFEHLEIELKNNEDLPRHTQAEMLKFWSKKFNHFSTFVNNGDIETFDKIVELYYYGPKEELLKYKYY